jgi:hypothetical protein
MRLLFLFLSILFSYSFAQALVLEGAEYVVMKDKDGDEERLMGKSEGFGKDKMVDIVFDIPVKFSKKTFRCDSAKETPWRLEKRVESTLELQGMIDALIKMPKPRALTPGQKRMLTKIPICEPYILQLKVISRLLSGYDFVRVQKLEPKEDSDEESTDD